MIGPNQNNSFINAEVNSQNSYMTEIRPLLSPETFSVVGKSYKGTAFIPYQFWNLNEDNLIINTFKGTLDNVDNNLNSQGYLAGLTWLENQGEQLSFCRTLGIGDDAGFKVGENILSSSLNPGVKGPNPYAKEDGIEGKTYFFGKILSGSQTAGDTISGYNDYFEQLGYSTLETLPIVTHVVMMPSGTVPSLKNKDFNNFNSFNTSDFDLINKNLRDKKASHEFGTGENANYGAFFSGKTKLYSDLNDEIEKDIVYINGLSGSNESYRNELEINSFDQNKILWQENNKLNTDSLHQIDRGNYLYAKFPCKKGIFNEDINIKYVNFIVSGSNTPSENYPDFEDFKSPFKKAKTPWIVSQIVNREKLTSKNSSEIRNSDFVRLFKFHTYDDGEIGNRFRIRITPVKIGKKRLNGRKDVYSTFNLEIFEYLKEDNSFKSLIKYTQLNLDPNSDNFIGRVVGTEFHFYDRTVGKIITKGLYKRTNPWIYLELNPLILDRVLEPRLIPSGFEEYPHINLSKNYIFDENHNAKPDDFNGDNLENICQTPLEFVHNLYKSGDKFVIDDPYWGVSFNNIIFKKENLLNKELGGTLITSEFNFNHPIKKSKKETKREEFKFLSYAKYFKTDQNNKLNTWVEEDYQNLFFHLEKIMITKNNNNTIDWSYALYRRDGKNINEINSLYLQKNNSNDSLDCKELYEYLNLEKDLNNSSFSYLSFDLFTYGGFDGLNIFDTDMFLMNNTACSREEKHLDNGFVTTEAYNTGLEILKEYSNCTTDILSVPGISTNSIMKNLVKTRDEDPSFLTLKEINFIGGNNNFITGSFINKDMTINKTQDNNDKLINETRINSNPFNQLSNINTYNKNEFIVYNDLLAMVNLDKIHVSSIVPTVKLMALNKFGPLDSLSLSDFQNTSTIKFISILDSKYSYDNTTSDFNKNVNKVIKEGLNAFVFQNKTIKLSSSNSTFDIRKNPLRQIYNSRILNSIKKNIKLGLFIDNDILFNNNSRISNFHLDVQNEINKILNRYKQNNIIKNYYTKVADNHNIKTNISDLERYILRGKISIELFTNIESETRFLELNLQEILSDLSLNTEENFVKKLITYSV